MREELAYTVPLGIPHSRFLSWSPEDQDKALAFLREKAKICVCGTRREDWANDRFAYIAEVEICPGCELLAMEDDNIPDGVRGVKKYLVKNSPNYQPNLAMFGDRPMPKTEHTEEEKWKGFLEE